MSTSCAARAMPGSSPLRTLHAGPHRLSLGARPWLMGVVNATPDSFSDGGQLPRVDVGVRRAAELLGAGADLVDIGGESAVTNQPAVADEEEIERVVPVVARVVSELGALVSVDTHKPAVAEAAVAAGAVIVNDVSGLRDPALAAVCARTGAALVVMHTRAAPKQQVADPEYDDVVADIERFLTERISTARALGVGDHQILVDPGPDFAKTPAQTVAALRSVGSLHGLGHPVLFAVSRKDFIGAITGRRPRERLAGTLAALAAGVDAGCHVLRVHDVAAACDFLAVRAALNGAEDVPRSLRLPDALRWERQDGDRVDR